MFFDSRGLIFMGGGFDYESAKWVQIFQCFLELSIAYELIHNRPCLYPISFI